MCKKKTLKSDTNRVIICKLSKKYSYHLTQLKCNKFSLTSDYLSRSSVKWYHFKRLHLFYGLLNVCLVHGHWGSWTSWNACPVTCGKGIHVQNKTRRCDNPAPSNGGIRCYNYGISVRKCNISECPGNYRHTSP